jgi:hypothetical protein
VPSPIPLFPSDIPWLDVLREADGYNLTAAQEAKLIKGVEETGLPDTIVRATAQSLYEQWPYKKRKHLDRTFLAWLWKEVARRTPEPPASRDMTPELLAAYKARFARNAELKRQTLEEDRRREAKGA